MRIDKNPITLITDGFNQVKELIGLKKNYPTLWILNGLEYEPGKTANMCICGFSRHLTFLDDEPLQPYNVQHIEITMDVCKESKWCFDTECKYNRTTPLGFAQHHNWPTKESEIVINNWNNLQENVKSINQKIHQDRELIKFKESEIRQVTGPLFWVQ
jgi:hypothetical protein